MRSSATHARGKQPVSRKGQDSAGQRVASPQSSEDSPPSYSNPQRRQLHPPSVSSITNLGSKRKEKAISSTTSNAEIQKTNDVTATKPKQAKPKKTNNSEINELREQWIQNKQNKSEFTHGNQNINAIKATFFRNAAEKPVKESKPGKKKVVLQPTSISNDPIRQKQANKQPQTIQKSQNQTNTSVRKSVQRNKPESVDSQPKPQENPPNKYPSVIQSVKFEPRKNPALNKNTDTPPKKASSPTKLENQKPAVIKAKPVNPPTDEEELKKIAEKVRQTREAYKKKTDDSRLGDTFKVSPDDLIPKPKKKYNLSDDTDEEELESRPKYTVDSNDTISSPAGKVRQSQGPIWISPKTRKSPKITILPTNVKQEAPTKKEDDQSPVSKLKKLLNEDVTPKKMPKKDQQIIQSSDDEEIDNNNNSSKLSGSSPSNPMRSWVEQSQSPSPQKQQQQPQQGNDSISNWIRAQLNQKQSENSTPKKTPTKPKQQPPPTDEWTSESDDFMPKKPPAPQPQHEVISFPKNPTPKKTPPKQTQKNVSPKMNNRPPFANKQVEQPEEIDEDQILPNKSEKQQIRPVPQAYIRKQQEQQGEEENKPVASRNKFEDMNRTRLPKNMKNYYVEHVSDSSSDEESELEPISIPFRKKKPVFSRVKKMEKEEEPEPKSASKTKSDDEQKYVPPFTRVKRIEKEEEAQKPVSKTKVDSEQKHVPSFTRVKRIEKEEEPEQESKPFSRTKVGSEQKYVPPFTRVKRIVPEEKSQNTRKSFVSEKHLINDEEYEPVSIHKQNQSYSSIPKQNNYSEDKPIVPKRPQYQIEDSEEEEETTYQQKSTKQLTLPNGSTVKVESKWESRIMPIEYDTGELHISIIDEEEEEEEEEDIKPRVGIKPSVFDESDSSIEEQKLQKVPVYQDSDLEEEEEEVEEKPQTPQPLQQSLHVKFDLKGCPQPKARPREEDYYINDEDIPYIPTNEKFEEPVDFSRAYRFPRTYLVSQIKEEEEDEDEEVAAPIEQDRALAPIKPMEDDNESIDDFLELENQIVEEEEVPEKAAVPNFNKMLQIIRTRLEDKIELRAATKEMTQRKFEHFVNLLARPILQLDGIYVLRKKSLTKVWGNGPNKISQSDIDTYWRYNTLNKQFEAVQMSGLDDNTDAISI